MRAETGVCIMLTAVVEVMCEAVLALCGQLAKDAGRRILIPRDIIISVRDDPSLSEFLGGVVVSQGS